MSISWGTVGARCGARFTRSEMRRLANRGTVYGHGVSDFQFPENSVDWILLSYLRADRVTAPPSIPARVVTAGHGRRARSRGTVASHLIAAT